MTVAEHTEATPVKQHDDNDKGGLECEGDQIHGLDEDRWYILIDKLDGVEPRGKLKRDYAQEADCRRAKNIQAGAQQLPALPFRPR